MDSFLKSTWKACIYAGFFFFSLAAVAQSPLDNGRLSGNFQLDGQYYVEDTLIDAAKPDRGGNPATNSFFSLLYETSQLKIGLRYEAYLPPLIGFDDNYFGQGIANRFASYTAGRLEVTAGNFYEQFGSGMAFRSYNEPQLGVDNSLDGIRVKYRHHGKWEATGIVGKHRYYFDRGEGILKGLDFEADLSAIFFPLKDEKAIRKWVLTKGNSLVSKYEQYTGTFDYIPAEVRVVSDRWALTSPSFSLSVENVFKSPDPSQLNSNITKMGHGFLLSSSYSQPGLGISLSAQRLDNMNFRSERNENSLTALFVNYTQAISKLHTYRLLTLYPQTVQPLGEVGMQAEVYYHIKRGSLLGGKYGTNISANYSNIHALDTTGLDTQEGYRSKFLSVGKEIYYQSFDLEVSKRLPKGLKATISYIHLKYNRVVMEGKGRPGTLVRVNAAVLELSKKLKKGRSIRGELQYMLVQEDRGDWILALLDFAQSPHWSAFISDEYNHENNIHYYSAGVNYVQRANRFSLSYGRQREGLLCVGGICRLVPAATALSFSVSSSF